MLTDAVCNHGNVINNRYAQQEGVNQLSTPTYAIKHVITAVRFLTWDDSYHWLLSGKLTFKIIYTLHYTWDVVIIYVKKKIETKNS